MVSKLFSAVAVLGLALSVAAGDAPAVTNQARGWYRAELLEKDNTTVTGSVTISPNYVDSVGVFIDVYIEGIPQGESLSYHIHKQPVPEDGNCYLTSTHLDPYNRGDDPPCNITAPYTCEVGDLSGKHGPAYAPKGSAFRVSYKDFFLSLDEGEPAYFGDLSVVVHAPDKSRLTCGNFEPFLFA